MLPGLYFTVLGSASRKVLIMSEKVMIKMPAHCGIWQSQRIGSFGSGSLFPMQSKGEDMHRADTEPISPRIRSQVIRSSVTVQQLSKHPQCGVAELENLSITPERQKLTKGI